MAEWLLIKHYSADMTRRKRILRVHINLCSIFFHFPYWVTIISWYFLALHSGFIMPNSFPFFGTMHCWYGFREPLWFCIGLIFHCFWAIQCQLKRTIHRCYIHANLETNTIYHASKKFFTSFLLGDQMISEVSKWYHQKWAKKSWEPCHIVLNWKWMTKTQAGSNSTSQGC